jgi:putative oxidoreductase
MNFREIKSLRFAASGPPSMLRPASDAEPSSTSSRSRQDTWGANQAEPTRIGDATYSIERYAMVGARILVAMIFMMTAFNIISQTLAEHAMAANGIPASLIPAMILAARALQFIAGLGLILGIYPRIAALGLLLFLIPATLLGHAFWQVVGTPLFPIQLINCSKNVCMAGGLIFIMATRNQPVLLPRPARAN